MSAPAVSVLMNCYNGEAYLAEAVRSVLAQTYDDFEVILWDNQSEDRSEEIFRSFDDSRLKYYRAPSRTPLGLARNHAAAQATGEWLAFLDVDDLWEPRKLEQQLAAAASPRVGLIYGYTEMLITDDAAKTALAKAAAIHRNLHTGYTRGSLPSGKIFKALMAQNFVPLSSLCVRRAVFERVGGFRLDLRLAEDFDLLLKVARISEAAVTQHLCCWYRLHSSNASHGATIDAIRESIDVVSRYADADDESAPLALQTLARFHARLALYEVRGGRYSALPRLFAPSVLPAAACLIGTNVVLRARALFRS
jgi:glycosyltransferase involved in cell wall biosynthesis